MTQNPKNHTDFSNLTERQKAEYKKAIVSIEAKVDESHGKPIKFSELENNTMVDAIELGFNTIKSYMRNIQVDHKIIKNTVHYMETLVNNETSPTIEYTEVPMQTMRLALERGTQFISGIPGQHSAKFADKIMRRIESQEKGK
jgi:hypothetical protein